MSIGTKKRGVGRVPEETMTKRVEDVTVERLQHAGIISSDPAAARAKLAGSSPALRIACPVCNAQPGAYCQKRAKHLSRLVGETHYAVQIVAHKKRRTLEMASRPRTE